MNFTDEQFEALAHFEPQFTTLTRSRYVSYVGFNNARRIDTILKDAGLQSANVRTNYACAECVKRLLEKAAKAWFEDRDARIAAARKKEAAKATAEEAPKPKKTSKPKTPKE